MPKVPKFPLSDKSMSVTPFPVFQGQTVTCPGIGEGFIFLVNTRMRKGVKRGTDVIVRYRADPAGHVRTYPIEDFFLTNKQLPVN